MAYMNKYQSDDYRRDELIRIIEHSLSSTVEVIRTLSPSNFTCGMV